MQKYRATLNREQPFHGTLLPAGTRLLAIRVHPDDVFLTVFGSNYQKLGKCSLEKLEQIAVVTEDITLHKIAHYGGLPGIMQHPTEAVATALYPGQTFDCALPQAWVDSMLDDYGLDVRGHFVWAYDNNVSGYPLPVTYEGLRVLGQTVLEFGS